MGATVIIAHGALVWTQIVEHILRPIIKPSPLVVKTARATSETVPKTLTYVGTTNAPKTVDVRARVEGWLTERPFIEGTDVREGDLLYVIDERPFQAQLDQAKAQLSQDEAALAYAREQVARYEKLVLKDFVTREAFDKFVTTAQQQEAAVEADRAKVEQASLNLSYCRMYAQIAGRIGRTKADVGNLVGQAGEDTVLTTIVPLDPIYVVFSPSDQEFLQIATEHAKGELSTTLSFQDGSDYPQRGTLEFINNAVNLQTSTVVMRAIFPNPDRVLLPGIYVNVHVLLAHAPDTVLVPTTALDETQGGYVLYVVDAKNRVDIRRVEAGDTVGTSRIITKGIHAGETVIVEGMHKVKPGMVVKPKNQ